MTKEMDPQMAEMLSARLGQLLELTSPELLWKIVETTWDTVAAATLGAMTKPPGPESDAAWGAAFQAASTAAAIEQVVIGVAGMPGDEEEEESEESPATAAPVPAKEIF